MADEHDADTVAEKVVDLTDKLNRIMIPYGEQQFRRGMIIASIIFFGLSVARCMGAYGI